MTKLFDYFKRRDKRARIPELKRYTNLRPEKVREIPEAVESNAESPKKKHRSNAREAVNQPSVAVDQSALQDRPH